MTASGGGDRADQRGGGLRERKKAQTLAALERCARELFARQGFAATTVAQIAAEANVSERTFFRYFASKEALLLPEIRALAEKIVEAYRARPAEEPALEAFRASLLSSAGGAAEGLLVLLRSGSEQPRPFGGELGPVLRGLERALAEVERGRLAAAGARGDLELRSRVFANVAVAAVRAALRTFRERGGSGGTAAELARTLGEAVAVVITLGAAGDQR
jgi:AcrR family transcriptional regulator